MKAKHPPAETIIFQQSRWIWPDDPHWDISNGYALFRKEFTLEKISGRHPLFITADQSYRLFINGKFVARGPARGFQAKWPYDEIDVRPYLVRGRNVIAIRAYNPASSNFQYLCQGFAGLLVAARWGKVNLTSDGTWKAIRQKSTRRDTAPSSMQLFPQEHIDLRKEGDWIAPDYDDSSWRAPTQRHWNSAPWFSLESRGIPLLREEKIYPAALLGIGEGVSAPDYRDARDIVALRFGEDRGHRPASLTFDPLTVKATGDGQFRSYLFDFGKTVVGSLEFSIEGAAGGEIIDTHLAETIDAATLTPDQVIPTHCRMAFGDRLIARPGKSVHPFYHHYGFRYLTVTVRDAPKDFRVGVGLNWIGYPFERKGGFLSSDADLNRIWETCAWTQQCCSLDAYVDTPWREQAQWWGDARVQAWNTFHFDGDPRLFRRGIAQIASQTTPEGVTYGHAPTMGHECILPDFTLIWFLTLWDYYWQTGSTEPLATHHETVQRALDYFRKHTDPGTGLIVCDPRYWLFLDWTDLFKDGMPTVYNLWLLIALDKLTALYVISGKKKAAKPLRAWAKKLRKALGRLLDKDGLLRDGIDGKGKIVKSTSIHSQTLGLMANLKGLDPRAALDQVLLPFIREEIKPKVFPSAYWITYVFSVLTELGHGAEVIAFIKKHWMPMADHGTTWENFLPRRGDESHSHAWSAHPLYHLMQIAGGITQTESGWREIAFRPTFHGDSCRTIIPTPKGAVISEWRRKGARIQVELKIPHGIRAKVELPGLRKTVISRSEKWTLPAKLLGTTA